MHPTPTRRIPGWILLSSGAAVLIVATLIFWTTTSQNISRRWTLANRKVHSMHEELPSFDARRPVLYGDSDGGNAWDDYAVALEKIKDFPEKQALETRSYQKDKKVRLKLLKALTNHKAALDALHRGTHRGTALWDYKLEEGGNMLVPTWESLGTLVALQRAYVWFQIDAGESRLACDGLLDAVQLARDTFAGGTITQASYSLKWLNQISEELGAFILSDKSKGEDLGRLANGLKLLDGSFPKLSELIAREGVCDCFSILAEKEASVQGYWRWGWSYRLVAADAIDEIESIIHSSANFDDVPWTEVRDRQEELNERMQRNDVVLLWYPEPRFNVVQGWRERRTHYNLLRTGAQFRATGEVLALPDWLGSTLLTKVDGRRLHAWSVGVDGEDNGGTDHDKDYILDVAR